MTILGDKYFTYILKCRNGELYTGFTTDINKRIHQHNIGKGAKYTRGRGPFELVYLEEFTSKEMAMAREIAIKRLKKPEKLKVIAVVQDV